MQRTAFFDYKLANFRFVTEQRPAAEKTIGSSNAQKRCMVRGACNATDVQPPQSLKAA
jgi:hypothetical protein